MPSDRNTAYPFLEQMRTEELEALLQQEFTAADGGEPDVDYIMAIMEDVEPKGGGSAAQNHNARGRDDGCPQNPAAFLFGGRGGDLVKMG